MQKFAIGLLVMGLGGCAASAETSDAEVSVVNESVGTAMQDSLGGDICAGFWDLVAGAGCGVVGGLCQGSAVVTVGATEIPCDIATSVACGAISASSAAAAHGCPE
jgi:hypothetical protein